MLSSFPSATKRNTLQSGSFASASRWNVHLEESRVAVAIGTLSGPGLINPEIFLPSQLITNVTWVRRVALGPQSPAQVPFIGNPCWADTGIVAATPARVKNRQAAFSRISPPLNPIQKI